MDNMDFYVVETEDLNCVMQDMDMSDEERTKMLNDKSFIDAMKNEIPELFDWSEISTDLMNLIQEYRK